MFLPFVVVSYIVAYRHPTKIGRLVIPLVAVNVVYRVGALGIGVFTERRGHKAAD